MVTNSKEKQREYSRQYRELHAIIPEDKVLRRRYPSIGDANITCECGQSINKYYYNKHLSTKIHNLLMNRNN